MHYVLCEGENALCRAHLCHLYLAGSSGGLVISRSPGPYTHDYCISDTLYGLKYMLPGPKE